MGSNKEPAAHDPVTAGDVAPLARDWDALATSLAALDRKLRGGEQHLVDPAILREMCARCEGNEDLRRQLAEMGRSWPSWAKASAMQGLMLAIARRNGDCRPWLELFMEANSKPPEPDLLPLQAWTVLHWYSCEGGPATGVAIPAWVWQYLLGTADRIQRLRAGGAADGVAMHKQVTQALGFAEGKRNVFRSDVESSSNEVAALLYEAEGSKGATGELRIGAVMEFFGITDARTARRRVARGRARFKPSLGWSGVK